MIVSISHDDYVVNFGGVQTLIGDEQDAFVRAGWGYLHIAPLEPRLLLHDRSDGESVCVSLRLNGLLIGTARFADLIAALRVRREAGGRVRLICHHLLGHAPEFIGDLNRACSTERPVFWIHDFFTLCPNFALMRNDVAFCGAPHPDSAACHICCYGDERPDHIERIQALFETLDPLILAPSALALSYWQQRSRLRHGDCTVAPHVRVILADSRIDRTFEPTGRAIRVAHLGAAAPIKGWHVFKEIARCFRDDARYTFLYLGSERPADAADNIQEVRVRVASDDRHAMVEAIAEARIDLVLIWSLAFETFSYVAHEALAGGAFVITRAEAGNVWPAVASIEPRQGLALDDEQALLGLFKHGKIHQILAQSTRRRGVVIPGGGAADWLFCGSDAVRSDAIE